MINNHQVIPLSIKILLWNSNDVVRQKNELKALITEKNLDIILISKAHLTSSS